MENYFLPLIEIQDYEKIQLLNVIYKDFKYNYLASKGKKEFELNRKKLQIIESILNDYCKEMK